MSFVTVGACLQCRGVVGTGLSTRDTVDGIKLSVGDVVAVGVALNVFDRFGIGGGRVGSRIERIGTRRDLIGVGGVVVIRIGVEIVRKPVPVGIAKRERYAAHRGAVDVVVWVDPVGQAVCVGIIGTAGPLLSVVILIASSPLDRIGNGVAVTVCVPKIGDTITVHIVVKRCRAVNVDRRAVENGG